jgi:hypothetical protein
MEGASSTTEGGEQASAYHPRQVRSERCCGVMLEDHRRGCPEKRTHQRDPPDEQQKRPTIPSAQPVIHGIIFAANGEPGFEIMGHQSFLAKLSSSHPSLTREGHIQGT